MRIYNFLLLYFIIIVYYMKTCIYITVKDEKRLIEFINYHIKIGIDFFIILDDNSIEDVKNVLIKNNINTDNYEIIHINGRKLLHDVYYTSSHWNNEIIPILNKKNIDYILCIDADEFLYIGKFNNITDLIQYYSPFDSLKINMLLFGSNNLIINNTDSIISQFNKCCKKIYPYVKTITKVSSICTDKSKGFNANSHVINVDNGITKNILNNVVGSKINITEKLDINYNDAPIYLAHYKCQDYTTYVERKVASRIFLRVAKKYDLAENVRNLIIENKLLFVNFFINNNNDDSEINLIHLTTTLPNDIIIFLKKYLKLLDHNETVNNDIINFMYNK